MTPFEYRDMPDFFSKKNYRVFGLSVGEVILILAMFVLIQYQSVTDGRTSRSQQYQRLHRLLCYELVKMSYLQTGMYQLHL